MKIIVLQWCTLTRKIVVHFNPQNDSGHGTFSSKMIVIAF